MADPPRHPGTEADEAAWRHQGSAPGKTGWGALLMMILVASLVLLVLVLHLTGTVGPGAH